MRGLLTRGEEWDVISPMSSKWALITGASSGIGRATAVRLADAGFDIYGLARRRERLEELGAEIRKKGRQFKSAAVDIRDRAAVENALKADAGVVEGCAVLVNNAGLARGTEKLQDGNPADWDEMFDTNVRALLTLTHLVLPSMVKRKTGHIVNLGSVAGRWVYPGGAIYCASKFAVRALSEGLRMDTMGSGVRVTNIEPGMVQTEFSKVRFGSDAASDRVYARMTPLTGEDIARTIAWCVQQPPHVTIQELVIYPTDQAAIGQVHRHEETK